MYASTGLVLKRYVMSLIQFTKLNIRKLEDNPSNPYVINYCSTKICKRIFLLTELIKENSR
jgi:hypothetical protein